MSEESRIFTDVTNGEEMATLKTALDARPTNRLVLYAKYGHVQERARFHDDAWIFCDNEVSAHAADLHVHRRFLIQTDLMYENQANLTRLLQALPNTFDYITIDEGALDTVDRITQFVNALRVGGVLALHYNNVDYSLFATLPEALRAQINYEIIPAYSPEYAGCIPYGQQLLFRGYTDEHLKSGYVDRMNEMLGAMGHPLINQELPTRLDLEDAIRGTTQMIAGRWTPATVSPGARNATTTKAHTAKPYMYNFVVKRIS